MGMLLALTKKTSAKKNLPSREVVEGYNKPTGAGCIPTLFPRHEIFIPKHIPFVNLKLL